LLTVSGILESRRFIGKAPILKGLARRADVLIARLSTFFKTSSVLTAPKWADLVKTAVFHQMPPWQMSQTGDWPR
jgi:hypothetical protein